MHRHFGISTVRPDLGGKHPAAPRSADTRATNVIQLHPLPAQSLRPDPLTDDDRSNIAGRFAVAVISICFLVPMILAGIMMHFH